MERKGLPTGTEAGETQLFDYERALARLGGDTGLFHEVVELFLEDSPQLLERARCALGEENVTELERAAHSLKNLSATFDADALTTASAAVERHAKAGDLERARAYFADMGRELDRLQSVLAAVGRSNGADR